MPLLACNRFLPCPEVKKWNEVIKKQMHMGNAEQAILTFLKIQQLGFHADNYTFLVLLKEAEKFCDSKFGFALHGQTIKTDFLPMFLSKLLWLICMEIFIALLWLLKCLR